MAENNTGAGTVNWRIDDVSINVTANAVPEPIMLALPIFGGLMLAAGLFGRSVAHQKRIV